jgi:hypothetical protein
MGIPHSDSTSFLLRTRPQRRNFVLKCSPSWIRRFARTAKAAGQWVDRCVSTYGRQSGEGWFEVIAGKSMPEEGAAKCFAYVQTYDTKPKRRLSELMKSQGLQANQQVTFLSDGADDVRELPLYLSPESEHWLDWFHVASGSG